MSRRRWGCRGAESDSASERRRDGGQRPETLSASAVSHRACPLLFSRDRSWGCLSMSSDQSLEENLLSFERVERVERVEKMERIES
eukprot:2725217-Rhodomonas_salina.3